ncbi:MAG TPA: ABC transporter substrate-binding protein [Solirubrobacteraceae bacterium]|nr:ABC transporter substrate-binding protein [Solirubrobacteraceae bacterium]
MKVRRWVLALAVALGLAGCGQVKNTITPPAGSASSLTLMLDYFPNADHVGIYAAQADGYFHQADLNVHIEAPTNAATPLQLLAAGKVDVAIGYEPDVLLARNQGTPLVSVAAIVQRPLTAIVSVGSQHITSPAKLRGKTVGDSGIPYQHAFLQTILAHAGVPARTVREVNVGEALVPAMISGRVNATLGAYWNYEAIELAQLHRHPNVIHMDQAGVPTYNELVFVVRKATIVDHPGLIRRFVQAVARGYEAARADPTKAVNQLIAANPSLDRRLQLASVRATLSSFFPAGNHPWGWQDPAQWNAFGTWMMRHRLIHNPQAIIDASTNELLAGQGI